MDKFTMIFTAIVLLSACTTTGDDLSAPDPAITGRSIDFSIAQIRQVPPENHFTVTTNPATFVLCFGATIWAHISSSGGGAAVTERGVCYGTSPGPTTDDYKVISGDGSGDFTCLLSSLESATMYFVRAYGIKNTVTTYGNEVSFTTASPQYGTVTDIDGNVYITMVIGTQEWMVENLMTTHYRDGTPITNIEDPVAWAELTSGAYCNYLNEEENADTYGRLYNWYAAGTGDIAPEGWHVPSLTEWAILENHLGGSAIAGYKLKEAGNDHWLADNLADNSTGFTALPGGLRHHTGQFSLMGSRGDWWTSTELNATHARFREMNRGESIGEFNGIEDKQNKRKGYAIRCVRD